MHADAHPDGQRQAVADVLVHEIHRLEHVGCRMDGGTTAGARLAAHAEERDDAVGLDRGDATAAPLNRMGHLADKAVQERDDVGRQLVLGERRKGP